MDTSWPGMCIINGVNCIDYEHGTTCGYGAKGVQIELDPEIQQLEDIIILVRGGLSKIENSNWSFDCYGCSRPDIAEKYGYTKSELEKRLSVA